MISIFVYYIGKKVTILNICDILLLFIIYFYSKDKRRYFIRKRKIETITQKAQERTCDTFLNVSNTKSGRRKRAGEKRDGNEKKDAEGK